MAEHILDWISPILSGLFAVLSGTVIATALNTHRVSALEKRMEKIEKIPERMAAVATKLEARIEVEDAATVRNDTAHLRIETTVEAGRLEWKSELRQLREDLLAAINGRNGVAR